eukprot:COSAG06_NODE_800_length_12197_cov_9.094974_14_plen_257_part_01
MSGTADDPIDLEALDAAIATADRADSTTNERVDAHRALLTKLKHLESGAESDIATHQIATALLTQLTTSGMPERYGLTLKASDALRDRTIAVMHKSRMKMGAKDVPISTLQRQVLATSERIQQQRAQRVDRAVDSVSSGVSPTSPPAELSTLTSLPHGGPSSPLEDRMQSALAGLSSALGQSKRSSDGPPDHEQRAKSPKTDSPEREAVPTTPPPSPRVSKRGADSPEQRSSRRKSASPDPNVSPIPETPSPTPREQ